MWIALGLIGALWFVGYVIAPDKNAPPPSRAEAQAAVAATPAPQPPAPPR